MKTGPLVVRFGVYIHIYKGLYYPVDCGDYVKTVQGIKIPIKQQVKWKVSGFFFTGSCD